MCLQMQNKGLYPMLLAHLEVDLINGFHATTFSLGHGMVIAIGMAFAHKLQN